MVSQGRTRLQVLVVAVYPVAVIRQPRRAVCDAAVYGRSVQAEYDAVKPCTIFAYGMAVEPSTETTRQEVNFRVIYVLLAK